MKKLNWTLTTSLFLTISCSTVQSVPERTPAGVFDSCKNAMASFFGTAKPKAKAVQKTAADIDRSYVINNHKNNTFTTGRNLGHYMASFSRPGYPVLTFAKDLERIRLNPNAHWLDAGGGMGFATEEATKTGESKFKSTLVSVETGAEDILDEQTGSIRRKVIKGKFIEDIADEEMPKSDLITDMYGPLAYSSRPDQVLRKYFDNLKKEGIAYIYLGDDLDKFGENNLIITGSGKLLTLTEWMESIPGVKVEIARIEKLLPDSIVFKGEHSRVAKITLTRPASEISIPELERMSFEEGGSMDGYIVPRMVFKETKFKKNPDFPKSTVNNSLKKMISNFRTGELEHTILDNLNKLNGSKWAHFSNEEIDWGELSKVDIKDDNYYDMSTNRLLSRLKEAASNNFKPQITTAKGLSGKQDTKLISDHNASFISFGTPDKTLQLYLDSLTEDGTIVLHMGEDIQGLSRVKVLTGDGSYITLKKWLSEIPGLSVSFKRTAEYEGVTRKRLKSASADDISINILGPTEEFITSENTFGQVAVIKIKDRAKINIPELKFLGKTKTNSRGYELPIYSRD